MPVRRKQVLVPPGNGGNVWLRELGVLAVLVLIAWQFIRLRYLFNMELPLATLQDLAAGTAYRPFQFRVLVPWLANGLSAVGWGDLVFCYQTVEFGAVVGLYYAFRYLLSGFFQGDSLRILPFAIFYPLPWNYLLAQEIPILLPYDLPAVMFFTIGLALLQRRNWKWFYPVFAVGCLNRETMIFLTLALVAVELGRRPWRGLLPHGAAQAAIWLLIKSAVAWYYQGNPGSAFELYHVGTDVPHFRTNLVLFLTPVSLLLLLSNFGFAWVILLAGRRKLSSPFLRRSLWIIPPFFLTLLIGTNVNESRLYGELIPLVMAGTLIILSHYIRSTRIAPSSGMRV